MVPRSLNSAYSHNGSRILWEDGERVFRRGWRLDDDGQRRAVLIVLPAVEHPSRSSLDRLTHEYELKDQLDGAWAVRPLDLVRDAGRTMLILEDAGGEPLDRLVGAPMEVGRFLRLAIAIAAAIGKLHQRGLVHKDIKPANIIFNGATGEVRLTGFGIAARLARERQSPHPPETIAGTLAYMAPEQTGRMNRSIDSRCDLYALGVTFYQMLTGALPFTASVPMEWVHCHLARRPVAPAERLREIPGVVSAIVMKLLAKRAEDRYQTAAGLESDLCRCEGEYEAQRRIDQFPLGEHDTPDRLLIPEKLYGRRHEVEALLASFDRVVNGSAPELMLVSGYSGIGKSSVVNELHPVLVPPRGLFASGKFDQYKRDIPYSTLAQAFQTLVHPLLGKSEMDLAPWRDALREALGPNARLIVDLVPEVKLIIGEPLPVPELPPQDAQRRFQMVFRQFIGVFARPEHPLALFLDDLQWLDAATLDLMEDLLSRSDLRHLLLIGAYRDNEVTAAHPLMYKLEAARATGRVQDIKLGPLTAEDLGSLVADTLRIDAEQAAPLGELVHAKTEGNPFFVIQFLHVLADEGLLAFDHKQARWSFDLGGIDAKQYTDNVVELLARKLTRLPRDTQDALRQFSCLGNVADVVMLSIVLGTPEEQVHAALWEGLRQQLIERLDRSYKFVHDRVQEAAYALIPEKLRTEAHLRIGRLLVTRTPPENRDETIFDIVNQLNRARPLITSQDEREQLAELNLAAGKRAISSSAYASALIYFTSGAALLLGEAGKRRRELAFALELHLADCEVCTGALQPAEERLEALATRAVGTVQRCAVACRRVDLYTMLGASEHAVAVGLECLRHVGIDLPTHPTEAETRSAYERIWSRLGSRAIEDVVDLPLMQDPEDLATLDVLIRLSMPALYTDHNLYALSVCRAANLALERGNSDAAPYSYAILGLIAGARYGHHEGGYRLGKMACDLLERRGWNHFGARTYFFFALAIPWTRPIGEGIDPARRALQSAQEHGDPAFAGFASRALTTTLLARGHPLDEVERQAEEGTEFVRQFGFFLDRISAPLALVRTLRGRTTKFGSLDDGGLTERSFEQRLTGHPTHAFLECYYWIRKLRARFFAGDYALAVDAADKAERWYETSAALALFLTEMADFHFYAALSRAARCEPMGPDSCAKHRGALQRHEQRLQGWAANCPQNFEDRVALVGAEFARIEGRPLDAMDLYEHAIVAARANGFVHHEAIAYELAARFYAARGFETIANAYLREARSRYLRWGADGKVWQLETLHPLLREPESAHAAATTIAAPIEHLDIATVVKVSQAVSGEMALERLIDTLIRMAIEHTGAERGLLLLGRENDLRQAVEATTGKDGIVVRRRDDMAAALPASILHYVLRSRDIVILDDAMAHPTYSSDTYIREHSARSILCLPLVNGSKVIGVLYLENNLSPHVFAADRVTVLKVIASQAAISLENARLYGDLEERERRIRRLVDANIIGIFVADLQGQALEANEAFLRIIGYDREDLVSGRVRRSELTPPEWRERDLLTLAELNSTGTVQPFEKEYFRKNGSRVPVLVGLTLFKEGGNEAVAFVLDLTERKRAEFLLALEKRSLEMINAGVSLDEILNNLCNSIDALISGACSTVLMMDPEGRQLWHVAGSRVPQTWLAALMPRPVGPCEGCCGTAAYRKERVIVTDVSTDPIWPDDYRDFTVENGIRAAWSEPLMTKDGEVLGTFALYSAEARAPTTAELELIEGAGHIAVIAMMQQRSQAALRKSEEALRESERTLRSAIDGIPGLVAILAPNGELEAVNRQILEYCGQSLDGLKSWGTNGTVHHEDLPHVVEVFTMSIASGIPYQIEQRLRRFDGEYRWFDNRGIPVRDDAGRVARWYVLLTDIDDRTRALARLEQMQSDFAHMNRVSTMGELAASLSHEILHPVATARNNARAGIRFLEMNPPNLDEAREALGCVVRDADRVGHIVARLRSHIKKEPPRREPFELNEAVREAIVMVRSAIVRDRIALNTRLMDKQAPVQGDRVQLQQVIVNLILNAIEAMSLYENGTRELSIRIEQDHAGGDVLVQVRDSGPGIDPGNVERVFEPFYTTKSSGVGMGLAICRSIIDGHGGRLWAEANEPRGAVFQFTLPCAQEDS